MRIVADTNVLLRAAVRDDPQQAIAAANLLRSADLVAVSVAVLCEFVWVLRGAYKRSALEVARSIRSLLSSHNVVTNHPAIEAGLAVLEKGGDFADGVIAYEGYWLGAEEFASFDKKAIDLLRSQGKKVRLLS